MFKKEILLSYIGWFLIFIGICLQQYWLFGIFFLIWIMVDLKNGQTYIFSNISKRENPIFYWVVVLTWFVLALMYLLPWEAYSS